MDAISTTLDAVCLAARIILESGGETYRAEETVERMCAGLGIEHVDALALPTGIMLTLSADGGTSLTRIVRVRSRTSILNGWMTAIRCPVRWPTERCRRLKR